MSEQLRLSDSQFLQGMPPRNSLEKLCDVFGYLFVVEDIFLSVRCFRDAEAQENPAGHCIPRPSTSRPTNAH